MLMRSLGGTLPPAPKADAPTTNGKPIAPAEAFRNDRLFMLLTRITKPPQKSI
jgi:hypothetical protein